MATDRDTRKARPALVAVLVAFVVAAVGLLGATAPAGAQYVPGQPGIIIDPPELFEDGGTASITGFGCPANSTVEGFIVVNGQEVPLASATTEDDTDGSFTIPVTIPPLAPGEYTILARCETLTLSTLLTIAPTPVEPTADTTTGTLPTTGSDTTTFVQVAALLIAVGGLVALGARKRRTSRVR